jgi:predicted ArsR family transcriptional regulator
MDEANQMEKLLVALRHPTRRSILSVALRSEDPLSPRGLADELEAALSNVSYHIRVLVRCDTLRLVDEQQVRGSVQHFYRPTEQLKNPFAQAALALVGVVGSDVKPEAS